MRSVQFFGDYRNTDLNENDIQPIWCEQFSGYFKEERREMFYKLMTILVMAAFYGFYFYKKWDQTNRGIRADYLAVDKTGFVRKIELGVKIGAYLIPVVQIFNIIRNKSALPSFLRFIGLLAAVAGTVIFIMSALTMNDNWRIGVPTEDKTDLVTSGLYSYSRNPAFVGFDLMYIGIMMMFFNFALFVLTAAVIALLHLQIVNVEEDYMTAAFGERYIAYKNTVNRYFGRKAQ